MTTGITIISSDLLQSTGLVTNGVSTRRGGVSPEPFGMNLSFRVGDAADNVGKNRDEFARALGVSIGQFALPAQQHGTVVRRADRAGDYPSCDGLVTETSGVCLSITVADCLPILLVDVGRKAIAAIHAGWRGTAAGISGHGVAALVREFRCRPGQMVAWIGPCAGPCCYVVGEDVAGKFLPEFVSREGGRTSVDLRAANVSQLVAAGVPRHMIEVSPYCTIHDAGLFHSYRRDGASSGRMMAVIALKP